MPTLAEKLGPDSSDAQIKAAISDTIAQLVNEGYPQQQAIATAFSQAEKATGKTLSKEPAAKPPAAEMPPGGPTGGPIGGLV